MSDSIQFRPADCHDTATIARLHLDSWRNTYQGLVPDDYLERIAPTQRVEAWHGRLCEGAEAPLETTLALRDGDPVGFSCLIPESEPEYGIYLDNLHVSATCQGAGLGKQLMARCARRTMEGWPGRPLFLYVLAGNAGARAFYRRLGGEESEPFDDTYPGGDFLVPVRRVTWPDVSGLLARLER